MIISSELIPHADTVLVFVPASYSSAKAAPLLFMLHGYSGNYEQWDKVCAGLQKYADDYGFIIACPDGFYNSWYVNSPAKPNWQYETFFFKKLVPEIFSNYKVDKSNIFITGLSMGGHGAMMLMLRHPEFFKSAGSTSGIVDITEFPDNWDIKNQLLPYNLKPENWKNNSVYYLINKIAGSSKQFIFDCGTEDFAYGVNKKLYNKCLELKLKATFISRPGKHEQKYWNNAINDHFRFFKKLVEDKES